MDLMEPYGWGPLGTSTWATTAATPRRRVDLSNHGVCGSFFSEEKEATYISSKCDLLYLRMHINRTTQPGEVFLTSQS